VALQSRESYQDRRPCQATAASLTGCRELPNLDIDVHKLFPGCVRSEANGFMISQTAEYALRAVVYLADQNGEPRTTARISEGTQLPAGYLAKVMQLLSRGRLVNSQRGLHGGFTLARDADSLTVLEVINAVDPIQRFHECPLKIQTHGPELCPLHRKLDDAGRMLEESFGDTTIASLLSVPKRRKPLCRFPIVPDGQ